jgi:Ca2+/Na+ antiporter
LNTPGKILAFTSVVEIGTGVGVLIDPALVVKLLLNLDISIDGTLIGRCFGIALLALALACWPGRTPVERTSPALRGMLVYNGLIALYLGYVGANQHLGGLLLWPAVVLHALVALLLIWTSRKTL